MEGGIEPSMRPIGQQYARITINKQQSSTVNGNKQYID